MFEKTFSFWRRIVGNSPEPTHETSGTATAVEEDRRLWMRYATDLQGNVQLADGQDKILANIRDLSVGGASLIVDAPVQTGKMVTLELAADENETRTVLACVVRAIPTDDGKWSLGCVFSRELTSDDLGRFGAHKTPAAESDQRTWVRFSSNLKANYRKVGDAESETHPATVLNVSANGIGLSVNPSLHAGALLNVDLLDKEGRMVRSILACVVHTTKRASGDYAVGCNFIRELREDELESLL